MGLKADFVFETKRRTHDKIFSGYQPCQLASIADVSGILSVGIMRF
jgi:hypothetical protein